ncbi:MAG: dihydroorotate dehydrogenase electron transfer subunit, partial [Deltaproteobacteria bacterium]
MPIFQEKARILKNQRVAQGVWEMRLQAPQIASAAYP